MTVLIFLVAIQWFEALAANIMIKPYEVGYWPVGAMNTTRKQWWTDDVDKMIHLSEEDITLSLFLGGFIKWHYILSMTTVLLILSIERSFACYFINDYEKKTRNGLLFCMVFGYHGTTFIATICFFFNAAHFIFGMLYIMTPNLIAAWAFSCTRKFNIKVLKSIEDFTNPHSYSLGARFQARENMRCFQMISRVVTAAFSVIMMACLTNLIMYMEWTPQLDTLWNLLFECAINLNPLLICPTLMLSVDAWKKFSICGRICARIRKRRLMKVSTISEGDLGVPRNDLSRKETDAYFDQLRSAWT